MSSGRELLGLVQGVRRRLRRQEAVAGATLGAAAALGLGELGLVTAGLSGAPGPGLPGRVVGLAVVAITGAALGAWLGCWLARPRLTPGAAARRLDTAIAARRPDAGDPDNGDRVRVAIGLVELADESRLAAAAVKDAIRSADQVRPAEVAPWRLPRALPALVVMMALVVPASLWRGTGQVASSRVAARPAAQSPLSQRQQADARRRELEAALREAGRLQRLAERLADRDLADLARRLAATLDELQSGNADVDSGQLAGLLADARTAAAEARAAAVRSRPATQVQPTATAGTDPASAASASGPDSAERKRRLAGLGEEPRPRDGADRSSPGSGASSPQDAKQAGRGDQSSQSSQSDSDRQLRRLGRDLDPPPAGEPGASPGAGPAGGGMAGRQTEGSPGGSAPGRQGGSAGAARARLAEAEARLRGALGGSAPGGSAPGGPAGPAGPGDRATRGDGADAQALAEFERGARGEASRAEGQGASGSAGPGATGGSGQGRGDGSGPPAATGAGASGDSTVHGTPLPAEVAEGPGPSRAESIALGAQGGFSDRGYDRTYRAYRAAVEETLDLASVPAGRAQLVRRYFELIRPRNGDE